MHGAGYREEVQRGNLRQPLVLDRVEPQDKIDFTTLDLRLGYVGVQPLHDHVVDLWLAFEVVGERLEFSELVCDVLDELVRACADRGFHREITIQHLIWLDVGQDVLGQDDVALIALVDQEIRVGIV